MKPKQFFFILLGAVGALIIVGSLGYYWASRNLHAETETLRAKLVDVAVADERINQLTLMKQQYEKLLPLLPKIEAAVPKTKQASEIALQIQKLAVKAGMPFSGLTFAGTAGLPTPTSQTVKAGDVLAIPINFELSGTYDQLQNFLQNLEKLNRYASVTNLETVADPKSRSLTVHLNVSVYVRPAAK